MTIPLALLVAPERVADPYTERPEVTVEADRTIDIETPGLLITRDWHRLVAPLLLVSPL